MTGCPFRRGSYVPCEGPFERHHVVPKQTIKGQYSYWHGLMPQARYERGLPERLRPLDEALADSRNLLLLCRRHRELVTNRRLSVAPGMLPEGVRRFAEEIGVGWYLDRWFSEEAA